jgi:hypothetical protein
MSELVLRVLRRVHHGARAVPHARLCWASVRALCNFGVHASTPRCVTYFSVRIADGMSACGPRCGVMSVVWGMAELSTPRTVRSVTLSRYNWLRRPAPRLNASKMLPAAATLPAPSSHCDWCLSSSGCRGCRSDGRAGWGIGTPCLLGDYLTLNEKWGGKLAGNNSHARLALNSDSHCYRCIFPAQP